MNNSYVVSVSTILQALLLLLFLTLPVYGQGVTVGKDGTLSPGSS